VATYEKNCRRTARDGSLAPSGARRSLKMSFGDQGKTATRGAPGGMLTWRTAVRRTSPHYGGRWRGGWRSSGCACRLLPSCGTRAELVGSAAGLLHAQLNVGQADGERLDAHGVRAVYQISGLRSPSVRTRWLRCGATLGVGGGLNAARGISACAHSRWATRRFRDAVRLCRIAPERYRQTRALRATARRGAWAGPLSLGRQAALTRRAYTAAALCTAAGLYTRHALLTIRQLLYMPPPPRCATYLPRTFTLPLRRTGVALSWPPSPRRCHCCLALPRTHCLRRCRLSMRRITIRRMLPAAI